MKKIICMATALFISLSSFAQFAEVKNVDIQSQGIDGFPVANFAISGNVNEQGRMFGKVLRNPGKIGKYLEDLGDFEFLLEVDGKLTPLNELLVSQTREFPIVEGKYKMPNSSKNFTTKVWAPLKENDIQTSALPAIMMEFDFSKVKDLPDDFSIVCRSNTLQNSELISNIEDRETSVLFDNITIASSEDVDWESDEKEVEISVKNKKVRVSISIFDKTWVTVNYLSTHDELIKHIYRNWKKLYASTTAFEKRIPRTDDDVLNSYMNWNILPAIVLTKCTNNGEVVVMGYRELNQRDSFWATWMHLVLFPDAERVMIEESASFQQPSGKIPTTVLPLIEREDDLDINSYFVLRVLRYVYYHNDIELGKKYLPNIVKALDWLLARDTDGFGLPKQGSYWGDWKDVKAVEDRIYSPYTALLYLAALQQTIDFVERADIDMDITKYETAYDKGYKSLNASIKDGGMWNGDFYVQLWNDNRECDKLLQDQTVGILFNVIEKSRAKKLVESVDRIAMTKFGVAETFPYYDASTPGFNESPGDYHNGGVWPHICYFDAWGRLNIGEKESAMNLIHITSKADLAKDFTPNERLCSITGENRGMALQGWNADYFGLVYFGILNNKLDNLK